MIGGKLVDQIHDYQLLKHKLLKGVRYLVSITSTVCTRIFAIYLITYNVNYKLLIPEDKARNLLSIRK